MQRRGLVPLVAAVFTALVFLPALGNGFLRWDDNFIVDTNTAFRGFGVEQLRWMFTEAHGGAYQPLVWLSYSLDDALFGRGPFGYHLTNVVLHALAAGVLAACAARLLPRALPGLRARPALVPWVSLGAALLWSVHPLRVESVAWVTERRDVLSGSFLLLSLYAWLRYAEAGGTGGRWWGRRTYWLALALFAASMLSKATAMGWGLVLLGLDAWPLDRWRLGAARRLVVEKLPFVGVAAVVAALALRGQVEQEAVVELASLPPVGRVVLAGHAAAFYVVKSVLPLRLRAYYARDLVFDASDPLLLAGLAATLLVTVVVFVRRKRSPALALSWGAYLVLLAPASGLVALGSHLVAERFTYLPSVPLTLLAAGALGSLAARASGRRSRTLAAGWVAVVLALGASSASYSREWRDTDAVFRRVLRFEPDNWMAHWILADVRYEEGRLEDAADHLRAMVRVYPDSGSALSRLAWVELRQGNTEEAVHWIERALAAAPQDAEPRIRLGAILSALGNPESAEEAYVEALRLDPDHMAAHYNYALLLRDRGDADGAVAHLRSALRTEPAYTRARVVLGGLLEAGGSASDAEAEYRAGLFARPGEPGLMLALGRLLRADPARRTEGLATLRSALALATEAGDEQTAAAARALLIDESGQ